jgi:hypothetical protein
VGGGSRVEGGRVVSCGHAAWSGAGGGVRLVAGPGHDGAESSSAGAGERCEHGGGPVQENGRWASLGK